MLEFVPARYHRYLVYQHDEPVGLLEFDDIAHHWVYSPADRDIIVTYATTLKETKKQLRNELED